MFWRQAGRYLRISFLGFDRNLFPAGTGDLAKLRETFRFSSYWLNVPPGEAVNNWKGQRLAIENAGFGFLVLFNGKLDNELGPDPAEAARLGSADGIQAVQAAILEDFPKRTTIFLDIEEGGYMTEKQRAYIHAWVDEVNAGTYKAGVYCSGIPTDTEPKGAISAIDIKMNSGGRNIRYFVYNDRCPPAPGCTFPEIPPVPSESGVNFAHVWQFAQSPQRPGFTTPCASTYRSGMCFPPGFGPDNPIHVDVNSAVSPDPSRGRSRTVPTSAVAAAVILPTIVGVRWWMNRTSRNREISR
jgi:hypothetical protein